MKVIYKNYLIEVLPGEGVYHAQIDGEQVDTVAPAKYKGVVIKHAQLYIDEQERINNYLRLKEVGL